MASMNSSASHRADPRVGPAYRWLLAVLGIVVLAAFLGGVLQPLRGERNFAPPTAQRVVEDWRGNSANLTPAP